MKTYNYKTICNHLPLNPGSCKEVFAGLSTRLRQGAWAAVFYELRQTEITWHAAAHWYAGAIDWDRLRRSAAPKASKMPQPVAVNPYFPSEIATQRQFKHQYELARKFFPDGEIDAWLFCPRAAPAGLYSAEELRTAIELGDLLIDAAPGNSKKTRQRFKHFCHYYGLPRSPTGMVQKGTLELVKEWYARPVASPEDCAEEIRATVVDATLTEDIMDNARRRTEQQELPINALESTKLAIELSSLFWRITRVDLRSALNEVER